MRYVLMGFALGVAATMLWPALSGQDDANLREVGVEWVNNYHGIASNLAACDDDAIGFYDALGGKGWTRVFNYGDDNAWEEDFKSPEKPGGGTDVAYADKVDFAYFSGHGNQSGFFFGVSRDDYQAANTDAVWGDQDLDWIVLSACLCLNYSNGAVFNRWGWPVFRGLHLLMGMDTVMSDTTDAGKFLVQFMTGDANWPSSGAKYTICQAWRRACWWALPANQYCAILGAAGSGGDTWNEYLPGYGSQVPDPYPISYLWYIRYPCG